MKDLLVNKNGTVISFTNVKEEKVTICLTFSQAACKLNVALNTDGVLESIKISDPFIPLELQYALIERDLCSHHLAAMTIINFIAIQSPEIIKGIR